MNDAISANLTLQELERTVAMVYRIATLLPNDASTRSDRHSRLTRLVLARTGPVEFAAHAVPVLELDPDVAIDVAAMVHRSHKLLVASLESLPASESVSGFRTALQHLAAAVAALQDQLNDAVLDDTPDIRILDRYPLPTRH